MSYFDYILEQENIIFINKTKLSLIVTNNNLNIIYKISKYNNNLLTEVKIINYLKDTNFYRYMPKIYSIKQVNYQNTKYGHIEMEYLYKYTELINIINKASNNDLINIMYKLLLIFKILHENKIIHKDIKLDNILINKTNYLDIKIIDFNLSSFNNDKPMEQKIRGTLHYIPPEIILKQAINNEKIDVWELGILFYYIRKKIFPFNIDNKQKLLHEIVKISHQPTFDIIDKMLIKDPNNRYTIQECIDDFDLN